MIASEIQAGRSPNTIILTIETSVAIGVRDNLNMINVEECRKRTIPIVRYAIGSFGPCLLDDSGIQFYSIYDAEHSNIKEGVGKILVDGVISACMSFGLRAERSRHRPNSNDVLIGNKKVCGILTGRKSGCMIGNFSFLVGFDYDLAEKVLNVPASKFADKPYDNLRDWLTTLRRELRRDVSIKEVKLALVKSFEDQYGMKLVKGALTETEEIKVRDLAEVYRTDSWMKWGKWSLVKEYWRPK